jgi:phage gp36-like protein
MGYCTVQDMVDRYGQAEMAAITDRSAGVTLDEVVAQRAVDDASSEMDSYLASRYRLPLTAAPVVLSVVCADIARFLLYKDQPLEEVRKRAEDARAWLKDLAKGYASLDLGPEQPAPGPCSFTANPRQFSRESLRGL